MRGVSYVNGISHDINFAEVEGRICDIQRAKERFKRTVRTAKGILIVVLNVAVSLQLLWGSWSGPKMWNTRHSYCRFGCFDPVIGSQSFNLRD